LGGLKKAAYLVDCLSPNNQATKGYTTMNKSNAIELEGREASRGTRGQAVDRQFYELESWMDKQFMGVASRLCSANVGTNQQEV